MASTLLLVCSTCSSEAEAFVDAAQRAHVQVACMTHGDWMPLNADHPLPVSALSVEEAVAAVDEWGGEPDGVLGVGLLGGVIAAHLSMQLGLDGHTPGGVGITANRERLMKRLSRADIPLPKWSIFSWENLPEQELREKRYPQLMVPLVRRSLEPRVRFANADSALEWMEDVRKMDRFAGGSGDVILEDLPRVSESLTVAGLTHQGQFYPLAFIDRDGPLEGQRKNQVSFASPSQFKPRILEKACRFVASACSTIGLDDGPVQATFRVQDDQLELIDVAGHPLPYSVGRCLRFGKGMTLEEVLVRHALRLEVDLQVDESPRMTLWGPSDVRGRFVDASGIDEAMNGLEVEDAGTHLSKGETLLPASEGGFYPLWIAGRGPDRERLKEGLERGLERMRIRAD